MQGRGVLLLNPLRPQSTVRGVPNVVRAHSAVRNTQPRAGICKPNEGQAPAEAGRNGNVSGRLVSGAASGRRFQARGAVN